MKQKKLFLPAFLKSLLFLSGLFGALPCSEAFSQLSNFPHLETFENEYLGASNQCDPICILYGTWRNISTDSLDWISDNNDTPTGPTGPAVDHTSGTVFGMYVYLESSCDQYGYPAKMGALLSSWYDFRNLTPPIRWEFWYHMYGSSMGDMHVDADSTRGAAWNNDLVTPWTDNSNVWKRKVIDLSAYAGKDSVRLRIRGITGNNAYSDMALDDILVYRPQPVDLSVTAISGVANQCALTANEPVIVTLTNYGRDTLPAGDTLPVCYRVDNQVQVCQTFTLAASLPPGATQNFTFTQGGNFTGAGLHTLTCWVQKPGDGYAGNNSASKQIRNFPVVTNYPYVEDFENGQGLWRSEGISDHWSFGLPAKANMNSAASGSNAWVTGPLNANYPNGEDAWVIGPCLNLSGRCNPWIDLRTWWKTETRYDGAVLQYSLNGGASWSRLGNFGDPLNWYNANNIVGNPGLQSHGWTGNDTIVPASGGWLTSRHALTGLGGQTKVLLRIAFASDPDVTEEGFAFDDVIVYDQVYLGPDLALCQPAGTVTLDARGQAGWTYLWSTSATTQSIVVNTPGTYWVRVTNGSCVRSDTVQVTGIGPGFSVTLGPDTTACGAYLIQPAAVPQSTWLWSTGDSTRQLSVSSGGNYFVDVTTPCGTTRSDTIAVSILPVPALALGPDTSVCGSYVLDAGAGGTDYLWTTGDTSQSLLADSSGLYGVTVTGPSGCTASDSLNLLLYPIPLVSLGPDTSICAGDTICLTAGTDPNATYTWSQGPAGASRCLNAAGIYFVTALSADNCSATDTLVLTMPDPPVAAFAIDTSNCPLIAFIDNSTGGAPTSWFWDFGDGGTSTSANPFHDYSAAGTGIYTVTLIASNDCGSDTLTDFALVQCTISRMEEGESSLLLYPNPNRGLLNIRSEEPFGEDARIEIFSMDGKLVFSAEPEPGSSELRLDWAGSGRVKGLWMVRIHRQGRSSGFLILGE